tara:strand:+ start:823 stop:1884 length:1062 start_codon:yes stop_codon:yes gene_type:complete
MKQINIAILGFGFMGKVYSLASDSIRHFFPDIPKVNIKAVLVSERTSLSQIANLKKRYGFEIITKNYNEILKDNEIDAIYIATPNNFHFEQIKLAIEYNKHILCDKPMVLSAKESSKILEIKKGKPNLILNSVFEYRYIPAVLKIKNLIQSNQLGELIQFRCSYLHGSYINERPLTWRLKPKTGGATIDLGPHVLDLVNFLIGKIDVLYSSKKSKIKKREVDDLGIIICKANNNVDGVIEVSRVSTGSVDDLRLEIHGSRGSIKWSLEDLNFFEFFSVDSDNPGYKRIPCFTDYEDGSDFPPPKVTSGWLMANYKCLYYFIKEISDSNFNKSYIAKFEDAHNIQLILNKLEEK